MAIRFKDKCTFIDRQNESARIKEKYPTRIPVIVEKVTGCKNVPEITKHKYLVPTELTMGQLIYVIRKKIPEMDSHTGMFIFINNQMPSTGDVIGVIYKNHVDDDGFLYIEYSGENTFG
jgi:GABA(A) receptor-associated protein